MITQEYLKSILHYDPETGIWTWIAPRPRIRVGQQAGKQNGKGYIEIKIDGRMYAAHRLAWFYMTGELPSFLDHINASKQDNRWSNLRKATKAQNSWNQCRRKNNSSGYKGVNFHKATQKWMARINVANKRIQLGLFETKEEAAKAYQDAAMQYHGEFARIS
jgi:hypothetical protein